jgi:hypothetical protein
MGKNSLSLNWDKEQIVFFFVLFPPPPGAGAYIKYLLHDICHQMLILCYYSFILKKKRNGILVIWAFTVQHQA